MDEITLEALRGSIRKWENIVSGKEEDMGVANCPLCRVFYEDYREDEKFGCSGCPVYEKTGKSNCLDSPYMDYVNDESQENAQRELDFLRSLLPKGEVTDAELNEPILPEDYSMYGYYWYVVDGKPTMSDWHDVTVAQYKKITGAKEIRRCDIVGRDRNADNAD